MNHGEPGPASIIGDATHAAIASDTEITNPVDRFDAYEQAMANAEGLIELLSVARRTALHEAAKTRSVSDNAEQVGVSPSRITQLMNRPDTDL
jgi:hypothetical protein